MVIQVLVGNIVKTDRAYRNEVAENLNLCRRLLAVAEDIAFVRRQQRREAVHILCKGVLDEDDLCQSCLNVGSEPWPDERPDQRAMNLVAEAACAPIRARLARIGEEAPNPQEEEPQDEVS